MAAETTGKPRRQLFNSPAKGGADNGVRGAAGGAADGVPACAATSGGGLKEHLESRKKRGAWTAAEDVELRAYVAKFGAGNWKHVAEATALKRDAQSCRLRWSSHLDPKPQLPQMQVNRAPFTPEEDARLLASVAWSSHGETKWAGIASAKFPSRTGYQIQSRWHSLVNKQRRWINEGKELPPCLEGAGTERGQGNTTTATDAAPVATPPGRSAGNTSPATVTLPPDAARGQSARKTAATDALAVVTGGTTAHATCPITPGTTASGAFSGAISVVASGNFPGLSSGCSSGVLPSVAPTVAASIAAGDSTDPSAVAAFILALQSAINGRPQPAGSGKNLEPSTPLNASVGAAATPSTTAAFILALQSAINSRPQSPSSGTQIDPSTPARVSLAAAAAAATSPLGASSVGATPAAAAAAAAAPSDVAAFIQALQSAINGRVLLEQRRRQQHAQEVQWEREKKLLLCGKQLRSEGREEGEGREDSLGMAAETTGSRQRRLLNSPATGGADSGVRGAAKGAADPVPARAATSGGLKARVKSGRKRGAWTAAEDAELRAYVAKYGAGNWKHVADATALKRDAQSCRLRWSSCLNPKGHQGTFMTAQPIPLPNSFWPCQTHPDISVDSIFRPFLPRLPNPPNAGQPRAIHARERHKTASERRVGLPRRNQVGSNLIGETPLAKWLPDSEPLAQLSEEAALVDPPSRWKWLLEGGTKDFPQRGGLSESELLAQHSLVNKQRRWINPPAGGGCPGGALPPKGGDEGRGELPPPLEGGGEGYEIQRLLAQPSLVNKQRRCLNPPDAGGCPRRKSSAG
ncbi:unnamed protein product [Closterium sp. NIES-64]|nr:unnamed protein product [Closterium sp. NIES-64]